MTVLIVGGSGFLGIELVRQATAVGHQVAATFATRPGTFPGAAWHRLDLRDASRIDDVLAQVEPSTVVNATSGGSDWAVTEEGPMRLATAAAKRRRIRLVHVSSDAVRRTDLPGPVSVAVAQQWPATRSPTSGSPGLRRGGAGAQRATTHIRT